METEEFSEVVFTAEVRKANVDEFVKHVFSNCNWSSYAKCFKVGISESGGGLRSKCTQGRSSISTPKRKAADCGVVTDTSEEKGDEPLTKRICLEETESHLSAKIFDAPPINSMHSVHEPRSDASDLTVVNRCDETGHNIAKYSENILPASLTQDNFEVENTRIITVLDPLPIIPFGITTGDQENVILNVKAEILHFNFSESNIVDYEDNEDDSIAIVATKVHSLNRCEEINLVVLSDDENEKQKQTSSVSFEINVSEPSVAPFNQISRTLLLQQKRFASVKTDSDLFVVISDPKPQIKMLAKKSGTIYANQVCSKISLIQECVEEPNNDVPAKVLQEELNEWTKFYKKVGKTVTAIKLNVWSWQYLTSSCPFNLYKLLRDYCPNVEELIFNVGPKEIECNFESLMNNVKTPLFRFNKLPTLRKIVVHAEMNKEHSKKIPTMLLQKILKVALNLEEFWYEFRNKRDAKLILSTMASFKGDDDGWKKLKTLRILYKESGACLGKIEMKLLSSLHAKNLQELVLDFYVWQDANEKEMKKLFERFPLLRKFVLCGRYKRNPLNESRLALMIPALAHLEHLEIASPSEFEYLIAEPSSQITNKSSSGDPPGKCLDLLPNGNNPKPGRPIRPNAHEVTVEDVKTGEQFIVSISIPFLMPKLKTIILDEFFVFDDLHFNSIPQISTFRVESTWHLSSKFPPENSRRSSFPFLTELQIPNYLRDESFLLNLPNKFPNVTKCWMYVPTVKVLRAFFKTMAESKLDTLFLVTKFYFESTFEICFFGERGMKMTTLQIRNDQKKWKELEKYKQFTEFVDQNDVEGPCWENIDELCDNEKYAGLGALKTLKVLEIKHVPMVLKIPMGNKDWKSPGAEFTENSIGFIKYPLSSAVVSQLPSWMKYSDWPNFEFMK